MNQNPDEGMSKAHWASSQIDAADRSQDAYRASRETRLKSWNWFDRITTFVPAAIAGLFFLLILFWVIRLFVA